MNGTTPSTDPTARDTRLAERGWTRRFTAASPRLEEMVTLYESTGHEVRIEPIEDAEVAAVCRACELARQASVVYTRRADRGAARESAGS